MLDELIESAKEHERAGAWEQALARYEDALSRLPREGTPAHAAELLRWIGTVHRQRGELELAGEAYEASLAIAELNDLHLHTARVLNCMGAVEHQHGNVGQAEELYRSALDWAVRLNDQRLAAYLDQNLGALHGLRGNLAQALDSYESALARSRSLGDDPLAMRALNNLGLLHLNLGNWDIAESYLQQAFEMAESAGDTLMTGTLELNRAGLHLRRKRFQEARDSCNRSVDVFSRLRSKYWTAEAIKFHGILHRDTGHPEQADACFAVALGLAEVAQHRLLQAEAQMEWAGMHLKAGRSQEGIMYLNRALRLFSEMQARQEVLDIKERLEKIESLYLSAVKRWSTEAFAATQAEQVEHADRVAELSCKIGGELGLTGWDLMVIRVGALIHDIGYTAMPASALVPSELASEVHPLLKLHTIAGDAIAKRLDFPDEIRAIVRSHHETRCGTGTPDRLAGLAISLSTQIVAVADAYDRLIHPRGGRPSRPRKQAIMHLRAQSADSFDPALLNALQNVLEDGLWASAA